MYHVLRKLEGAFSNIRLRAIFYIYILSKATLCQNTIVFSPKTRRVEDKFVLVSHILSAKFKSSWHVVKWIGCMNTDEKISGSKPFGGFLFLTEEFNRETVVVQHTSG